MQDHPFSSKDLIPTLDQKAVELRRLHRVQRAKDGLLNFTAYTKPDYEINWHHRKMAQKLNAFVRGEIKRLMIFMPPRNGKSELVSRRLPAFIFGRDPDVSIIGTSYGADLASRMNRDVQKIIQSDKYTELFPGTRLNNNRITVRDTTSPLQNMDIFEIVGHAGVYRSAGVGGAITGMGGKFLLIDDPHKSQEEADSEAFRAKVYDWYGSTLYTRLEKDGSILLTMTRWHEADLAGQLLALAESDPSADQWEVINFPAICDREDNPLDERKIGDPLWANKFSLERLQGIKSSIGSRAWAALYQQRPAPDDGNVVHKEWWKEYTELPPRFDCQIQSWDLTFTGTKSSDWVVGQVWGKVGAEFFLLDQVRRRMSFTETQEAFLALSTKWPRATAKYVEEAANGYALIDSLKKKIPGIIGVKPKSSKIARAHAVAPRIEAGNVLIPSVKKCPWVADFLQEWQSFPNSLNDDQVDATTQAIQKLGEVASTDWMPISITGLNRFA